MPDDKDFVTKVGKLSVGVSKPTIDQLCEVAVDIAGPLLVNDHTLTVLHMGLYLGSVQTEVTPAEGSTRDDIVNTLTAVGMRVVHTEEDGSGTVLVVLAMPEDLNIATKWMPEAAKFIPGYTESDEDRE